MLKKIFVALVVLLVVVAGAGWYLLSSLDSIAKNAIEKFGSQVTGTSVSVDNVRLLPFNGAGTVSGLMVGNPAGFATPHALTLDQLSVTLDMNSLLGSGPIVIKEIDIVAPHVTYEVGGGGSNLQTLERNARAYTADAADAPATAGAQPQRKLIIEDLYVRDGQVDVSATVLQGHALSAPLPEIHLSDIGADSGGATPGEVAQEVVGAISKNGVRVGAGALAHFATSAVTGVAHGVTGGATGVGKGLKGLFGN
jgi:uncharacterized protein involved in outer membrane biogenesis